MSGGMYGSAEEHTPNMRHFETVKNKQTYTHHTNLHFPHGPYTETKTLVTRRGPLSGFTNYQHKSLLHCCFRVDLISEVI